MGEAAKQRRPPWFGPQTVLGELGLVDTPAGRRAYAERMRDRAVDELSGGAEVPELAEVRTGRRLGGAGFRERMLRLVDAVGEGLPGVKASAMEAAAQRDHGMNEARRLLEAGHICLALRREDLAGLRKGDERKAAIAAWSRTRTAVPNVWIAQELQRGHTSRVSHCARNAPPELLRKLEGCRRKGAKF